MIQYGDQSGMMIMSLGFFPGNISVYAKKCQYIIAWCLNMGSAGSKECFYPQRRL